MNDKERALQSFYAVFIAGVNDMLALAAAAAIVGGSDGSFVHVRILLLLMKLLEFSSFCQFHATAINFRIYQNAPDAQKHELQILLPSKMNRNS